MIDHRVLLAVRFTEERARLGFSQADFARKLGVSREGLRLYEAGQRGMPAELLAEAAALGLDVQYVVAGLRAATTGQVLQGQPASMVSISSAGGAAVGVVQNGATLHVINTARHVTKTVAEVRPGADHISDEQAATLIGLVNDTVALEGKLKREPKSHRAVWAALNAFCGVPKYRLIKSGDFEKARTYLHQWAGRLNAAKSAPVIDGDAWRRRRYAYIKINSKDDDGPLVAYLKRNFKCESLTDLSNEQLEQTYRYVAGRKPRRVKMT